MQIDFDPSQISYDELLAVFWDSHLPTYQSASRQYANILHYHSAEQREAASASAKRVSSQYGKPVRTEIRPAGTFYVAEDYHQKYYLRSDPYWLPSIEALYLDAAGFRDSTLAARINGCLAGYCTRQDLSEEMESYGLSPAGKTALGALARDR